jgi:hypothetical protein
MARTLLGYLHPGKIRRNRGPRYSRSLGGRLTEWLKEQSHRDYSGAAFTFYNAAPLKVPSKDTAVLVAALTRHARKLPVALRRSLTWDRGLEMAKHKAFTMATDVKVYFCDPQSPW